VRDVAVQVTLRRIDYHLLWYDTSLPLTVTLRKA
jgi:hypothetical protein